ncbi:MAG: nitrite reductase large subunit [Rhodospirillales bacterium RIFCSPLOWO2_12_FULL_58_28]|nr:MAG: nitrite reductase large subunit [Rhodospirillales bacterium RIFCSPLOWO2_02_FULL_58_16]OHC78811.1 MAG: nitrite reductase large subunit [Rhodospirillales bacterium RIFCSPLOWO2_12_FULL_58_28]
MKRKLVVIGNGMAGMRTVEELLKLAPDLYDITVFGAEPHGNYNRILLSPVLAGDKTISEIMINDDQWYADNGITLHKGEEIVAIDRIGKWVRTADGVDAAYDRLLLATGSDPIILPVPGNALPGVTTFRNIHDVETMIGATRNSKKAVVIGGGLLGLEAAHGLMKRGMDVAVVHLMDMLMERQLDEVAAAMLRRSLEERGLTFYMPAETVAILGDKRVKTVRLKDGAGIPADIVVMAVGIRPRMALAQAAGIHCERGIVVGETMQTFDPNIYAVGECVQFRGKTYGMVAPLFKQAKVCANHLARLGFAAYSDSVLSTKLKVSGINLYSAGDFRSGDVAEQMVMQDAGSGVFKKLVIRNNRLEGVLLYGDTANESWYYELMRGRADISELRSMLLFGQGHLGDAGHGGKINIAGMSDKTEVCGCNGVTKGVIVEAISSKGLFTLEDVRVHTKASASCGSCTGMVEQILASTLGGNYTATPTEKPVCGCTDHTHDEVRRAIFDHHLTTIPDAMRFLEWRTPDGCPRCRPALNYYLISAWPAEAVNDLQSREHNERVHANIQQDGSYSVVPRTWGGLTNAKELRAVADCADKLGVPVKITGGQRLAIPFVKKKDLPGVWAELGKAGLVSGFAYGKAVRSVKSCVGKGLCRFGTQDSLGLGIMMEKTFWGAWTPHKFKMGVSGCPRNCAESTIKDFGVVGVESGWELHVGGTCGIRVRATDFLCKVGSDAEVTEYAAAFLQLYREEGHYRERSSAWIERVGLPYVKQRVVEDDQGRAVLLQRFMESQKYAQNDPWEERAQDGGEARHEYFPLMEIAAAENRPSEQGL